MNDEILFDILTARWCLSKQPVKSASGKVYIYQIEGVSKLCRRADYWGDADARAGSFALSDGSVFAVAFNPYALGNLDSDELHYAMMEFKLSP